MYRWTECARGALLVVPLALGCGSSAPDGGDAPDSGTALPPDGGGGGGGGAWERQQVSKSLESASYGAALAITASGELWIAFAESEVGASFDQDVVSTKRAAGGGSWSAPEARNPPSDYQFTYPSMVAVDDTVHLVMNGRTEVDGANDIYYSRLQGGAWEATTELTTGAPGTGLGSYQPVLAASGSGSLSVAYVFAGDVEPAAPEIRVAPVVSGQLAGSVVALDVEGGCDEPALVVDDAGVRHLLASCGAALSGHVYYTNDAGGTFAEPEPLPAAGHWETLPALALDPDGATLHAAWFQSHACPAGNNCGEIYYAARRDGAWSTPVAASGGSDTFETEPTLAVDAEGTLYIAFQRNIGDDDTDVYVATSADGVAFAETLVTEGTEGTRQVAPRSMRIDPLTGAPHFTFDDVVGGDPFNMEIWHARLR